MGSSPSVASGWVQVPSELCSFSWQEQPQGMGPSQKLRASQKREKNPTQSVGHLRRQEARGLPAVKSSTILDLTGSSQFVSYIQGLRYSFRDCALPSSFLSHLEGVHCAEQFFLS